MNIQDIRLLNEVYKASKIGMHETRVIFQKSKSYNIKNEMQKKYDSYYKSAKAIEDHFKSNNILPDENSLLSTVAIWSYVSLESLEEAEPQKIFKFIINNSNNFISDISHKITFCKNANNYYKDLATEFIKKEKKSIESLSNNFKI